MQFKAYVFNFRLKPMCREYSGRTGIIYKPLGILKRARVDYTVEGTAADALAMHCNVCLLNVPDDVVLSLHC